MLHIIEKIFICVLKLSLMGSLIVLIIMPIRSFLGKFCNAHINYSIWFLLVIRLCLPIGVESNISIYNLFNSGTFKSINPIIQFENHSILTEEHSIASNTEFKIQEEPVGNQNATTLKSIISLIWLFVFIFLILGIFLINLILELELKKENKQADPNVLEIFHQVKVALKISPHKKIHILSSDRIATPCICGFITTKLLLPKSLIGKLNSKEIYYIILHELSHYKRRDLYFLCITSALKVMHWFNPLIWFGFYKMERDCEVACDATALNYCDSYLEYGQTLIKILSITNIANNIPVSFSITKSKNEVKRRIIMLSRFNKLKKVKNRTTAFSVIFILVFGCLVLTNPLATTAKNKGIFQNDYVSSLPVNKGNSAAKTVEKSFNAAKAYELSEIISYDKDNKIITIRKDTLSASPITVDERDKYYDNEYMFYLRGNINDQITTGGIAIEDDDFISSIKLNKVDDTLAITISEKLILAFNKAEDSENLYFKAVLPKEKYPKIVVIDAAHGAEDFGATTPFMKVSTQPDINTGNIFMEKEYALKLALKINELFANDKENDIKVYLTRTTDKFISLEERVKLGNDLGNLFISLHLGFSPNNTSTNGSTTYYYKDKELAQILQDNLVKYAGTTDSGIQNAELYVVKNSNIPAVIIEPAFISNPQELEKLASDNEFNHNVALGIYKGIKEGIKNIK